ncbi:hypothetical protein J7I01_004844 [Vibrio parahaemolyticus]|nr:hypothetical protein [Vibrio parahaemolyticus]
MNHDFHPNEKVLLELLVERRGSYSKELRRIHCRARFIKEHFNKLRNNEEIVGWSVTLLNELN